MRHSIRGSIVDLLPHGYHLPEADWQRRHRLLLYVLVAHVPGLALLGLFLRTPPHIVLLAVAVPAVCLLLGWLLGRHRRVASLFVTGGFVYSSAALVVLSGGTIEAHFHFFIIIGFIALYQDWVPFLFNVLFTVVSHGVGSAWPEVPIFNHPAALGNPWLWSLVHGVAVLVACVGMALFWRVTEDSQREKDALQHQLAEFEINRRQFTSDMLVNLARRNQGMLYRQLEIINQLEESEQDPDALAELFKLDHLATRVQRNAESLLVLSGEQPPRVWREPVPLRDVVRAAIAETEDLERVSVLIDDRPAIAGHCVTDVTHLLAELTENAVRFSLPDSPVRIRHRRDRRHPGGELLIIEDRGTGMNDEDLAVANFILAESPDIDLAVAQRLGFHVVARLGARHRIRVSLSPTPGSGVTAVVALPPELFESNPDHDASSDRSSGSTGSPDVPAQRSVPARRGQGTSAFDMVVMAQPNRSESNRTGDHRAWLSGDDTMPGLRVATEIIASAAVVPPQRSEPVEAVPAEAAPAAALDEEADGAPLRRRVPQSHLAPELREPGRPSSGPAELPPRQDGVPAHQDQGSAGDERAPGVWFEPATDPDLDPDPERG